MLPGLADENRWDHGRCMKITEALLSEHAAMYPHLRFVREQTRPNCKMDKAMVRCHASAIKTTVKAHATVEEPYLLLQIKDLVAAKHALKEHVELDRLLECAIKTGDQAALHKAVRLAIGHFKEEERDVFPAAEKLLGPTKLMQLGVEWALARGIKL
jgi:hypothetical protein